MSLRNPGTVLVIACSVFILSATTAGAQPPSTWSFDVAGGASATVGEISSRLNTGWNVDLRGGYDFDNGWGLFGDFTYNGLGVSKGVLQTLDVPSGTAHAMSLTAGPRWQFPVGARVQGYVLGGVGWYRRTVEFLQPTVAVIDVIDPWWGYVGPVLVPANQVLGSVTKDAFGGNVGGGVSFSLRDSAAAVFVEIRYHYANTKPVSTAMVPVSVGIRWSGQPRTPKP
jgi:hypothetical protein